jgi:N-formylglutamate deformylase
MDDEMLIRLFEAGEVPPGGFHHREHVRVAWWYLRRHSLPEALERFSAALRHFATVQGKPTLFHATITTAFVLLIHERLAATGREGGWDEFAAQHSDLLTWRPSVLDRYYAAETLGSERARQTFVMPDRVGMRLAGAELSPARRALT